MDHVAATRLEVPILSNTLDAVLRLDQYGVVEYWSDTADTTFGYQANELEGCSAVDSLMAPKTLHSHCLGFTTLTLDRVMSASPGRLEGLLANSEGDCVETELTISDSVIAGERKYCLLLRDLTPTISDRYRSRLNQQFQALESELQKQADSSASMAELVERLLCILASLSFIDLRQCALLSLISHDRKNVFYTRDGEGLSGKTSGELDKEAIRLLLAPVSATELLEVRLLNNSGMPIGFMALLADSPVDAEVRIRLDRLGEHVARLITTFKRTFEWQRYRNAVEQSPVGITVTDLSSNIEYVNEAQAQLSGYSSKELLGRNMRTLRSGLTSRALYKNLWTTILKGEKWIGELQNQHKDETSYWIKMIVFPLFGGDGKITNFISLTQDITASKLQAMQLDFVSTHDVVTGFANRALFTDRLKQAIKQNTHGNQRYALVVINIKDFKKFNSYFGFAGGNRLIRAIGTELNGQLRPGETIGRFSGPEFFLLLQNISQVEELEERYKTVLSPLQPSFGFEGESLDLQFITGASIVPGTGADAESLMMLAEENKHASKAADPASQIFVSGDEAAERPGTSDWMYDDLLVALEQDQFELYFQPQINMYDGRVPACEALLRWNHPERGLIGPLSFLPFSESTGLIVPIGEWVLKAAVEWLHRRRLAGQRPLQIAINLSAKELNGSTFMANLESLVKQYEIDPKTLQFELTESILLGDMLHTNALLSQIREMGFSIAVDDFGTGYSNLQSLKQLPIDKLKIDRCFVADITQSAEDQLIIKLIIQIGKTLGLTVVAEGVEHEAQLKLLRRMQCDGVQGFHFARPLPEVDFLPLVDKTDWIQRAEKAQESLLIVDDEAPILKALTRMLRKEPYRILTAENARDGLELLAMHEVSVVISDQRMPEMSGSEFLSRVKKMYPSTQRIMLSGYTDIDTFTKVVNEGAVSKFILKPWDDEALKSEIDSAFKRCREAADLAD